MDPISMIVAALLAGAAAGASDTAGQAVKDAYSTLKSLLRRLVAGNREGEVALEQAEAKPEVWRAPLEDVLRSSGADQDQNIVAAAEKLQRELAVVGLQVTASGDRAIAAGGNIGDVAAEGGRVVKPSFGGSVTGSTITTAGGDAAPYPAPAPAAAGLSGRAGSVDPLARLVDLIRVRQADPDVETSELVDLVDRLRAECGLGPEANPVKVRRWLRSLADMAPDLARPAADAILNPASGASEDVRSAAAEMHAH